MSAFINNTSEKIKKSLSTRNARKNLIGAIAGAIGGYLYYRYVGCLTGGCAITSSPYMSILWGAAMGFLLADIFKLKEKASTGSSAE